MLRLALPVLIEQTLIMLIGLVDTWLAGRFLQGERHLAAIGLIAYLLWLLPSLFSGIAIGATALVARFVGAGQPDRAAWATNQALLVGAVLAATVTAGTQWLSQDVVRLLRLPPDAAPLAVRYLHIMVPAIPAIMVQQVGIASLRGAGDTVSGLAAMGVVNVVNILMSVCLVVGLGPAPRLGWDGLAIGTAAGHMVGATIILGLLIAGRAGLGLGLNRLVPQLDLIRRLLRVGLPGGADVLAIVCCHLWFVSIINALGTAPAAAHSLAVRIESLAYLPGAAFQVAAATMAGQFLGAGDPRRASRSVMMACLAAGSVMITAGLVMFFAGQTLAGLFVGSSQPQTAATAGQLLRLVAFAMPSLALTMVLTGALRGAGDTRWPLLFTFIGFLGMRIPLAYWLAWPQIGLPLMLGTIDGCGLGVLGAWWAMVIDLLLRSLMVVARFVHGGWKHVRV